MYVIPWALPRGPHHRRSIGNIVDRVRLGYVVDMFHFQFWPSYPVFNVADICIVTGAVLGVIYYLWIYERFDQKRSEHHGDGDLQASEADAGERLDAWLCAQLEELTRSAAAGCVRRDR